MRGREKLAVGVTFAAAAAGSGALVGFAAGALAAVPGVAPPGLRVVAGAALAAVLADGVAARTGLLHPLSVGRQVPALWGRVFSPRTVALLYGTRLGVGPLTLLPTWTWWAAMLPAAAHGPGTAALAGATFGAVRIVAVLAVAEYARREMSARMRRVRAAERHASTASAGVVLGACASLLAF